MRNIIVDDSRKTLLSVSADKVELIIGKDLDRDNLSPFIDIIDELVERMSISEYYGHFSFSKNRMEVTWSQHKEGPTAFDLTYGYDL